MPIKPENLARYPANWPEISAAVRRRADNCCEWEGCGARNHSYGYWDGPKFVELCSERDRAPRGPMHGATRDSFWAYPFKIIEIVLTVAHLDHQPENCADENLRAWCQRHHLAYDLPHHLTTAYMTRKAQANTMELPL